MSDAVRYRLKDIEFFARLQPRGLKAIERQCDWRTYRAHQLVFDRADQSRDVFFVARGSVRVVNYARSGREISFDHVKAGGYFGELAALDGRHRSAVVVAAERCLLASLPAPVFVEALRQHHTLARHVMGRLSAIVRIADDRIIDLSTLRAEKRVYLELLRAVAPDADEPNRGMICPAISHARLAARASTTRETVMRVFRHLEAADVLERAEDIDGITIKDRARLEVLINTRLPGEEADDEDQAR